MRDNPIIKKPEPKRTDDVELSQLDEEKIDVDQVNGMNYPIMERLNNGLIWPEGPKGRIDLTETYEVSSVPKDPGTPLESVRFLEKKGVMPK